jgi:hypothetical protein
MRVCVCVCVCVDVNVKVHGSYMPAAAGQEKHRRREGCCEHHVHVCMCAYVCMCVYACMCVHACMCVYVYVCM